MVPFNPRLFYRELQSTYVQNVESSLTMPTVTCFGDFALPAYVACRLKQSFYDAFPLGAGPLNLADPVQISIIPYREASGR